MTSTYFDSDNLSKILELLAKDPKVPPTLLKTFQPVTPGVDLGYTVDPAFVGELRAYAHNLDRDVIDLLVEIVDKPSAGHTECEELGAFQLLGAVDQAIDVIESIFARHPLAAV